MFQDVFEGVAGFLDLFDAWAGRFGRLVAVEAGVEVGSGLVLG